MNPISRILFLFLGLLLAVFLFTPYANAAGSIAKVFSFQGEVVVQSGMKIYRPTEPGQALMEGDRVQTKQGEAQVTFTDGSILRIRPFSSIMIQEREEKKGWWIFKEKRLVRRITCFVGKLWFKSGVSKRTNYLQTPTAVCGVRGSIAESGYDPVKLESYLNLIQGEADIMGEFIRGFFEDPGISAAEKSRVFEAMENALAMSEAAETTKEEAQAKKSAIEVVKQAADVLKDNPDATVSEIDGELASAVADASIAVADAEIAVEEIKEAKEEAERAAEEARRTGDEEALEDAREALERAEEALEDAEEALEDAREALEDAREAANEGNLDTARDAADRARDAADRASEKRDDVAPTTSTTGTTSTTTSTTTTTTTSTSMTTTSTTTSTTTTTLRPVSPAE